MAVSPVDELEEKLRQKFKKYSDQLDAEIHDKDFRRDLAARLVVIWTLLSRIPLPREWWPEPVPAGNRALALAPLAGGLMGLLTGLVVSAASMLGMNGLASAWVGAAFYFLTGWALHLDGWGDLWDGIGSGRSGEALRSVMKDSHLGSYGAASLILAFGLWTSLLASVRPEFRLAACITAGASARFAEVTAAFFGRYPWDYGMGKGWVDTFGPYDLFISVLCLIPFLPLSIAHYSLCAALSALTGFLFALRMNKRLGGVNGDVLGAAAVAAELISMAVWAL